MREIRLEYVHRGQTYLTASHSQLRYFLISRRDGENNGFLAGVPLLPPPSRLDSRPNSLPLPFRTPDTQARRTLDNVSSDYRHLTPNHTISFENVLIMIYATLTFKTCHNHIYLYRNHPFPSTATCTPKKHIERTLLSSHYS